MPGSWVGMGGLILIEKSWCGLVLLGSLWISMSHKLFNCFVHLFLALVQLAFLCEWNKSQFLSSKRFMFFLSIFSGTVKMAPQRCLNCHFDGYRDWDFINQDYWYLICLIGPGWPYRSVNFWEGSLNVGLVRLEWINSALIVMKISLK